jgi:hypothetical protein
MMRFDALGSIVAVGGLWLNSISLVGKGGGVDCVLKYLDSVFLPPDSLSMISAV